jgi:hypothetical protein
VKLCVNCKNFSFDGKEEYGLCNRIIGTSVVTGKPEMLGRYANIERGLNRLESYVFRRCGTQGRFFEEKK